MALHAPQFNRTWPVLDLYRKVEVLEHTLKTDHGLGKPDLDVGQGGDRSVEPRQVGGKGDDGADGDCLPQHQVAAHPVDQGRADGAGDAQPQEEPAAYHGPPQTDIAHVAVRLAEAGHLLALATEGLDQENAVDAQRLGDDAAHVGAVFHGLAADAAQNAAYPAGRKQEQRQHQHRE